MDKWYEDSVYIKMCEKAEEIQKLKRFKLGDIVSSNGLILLVRKPDDLGDCLMCSTILHGNTYFVLPERLKDCIWLPRQEDLQKMVEPKHVLSKPIWYVYVMRDWVHLEMIKVAHQFTSMEQLWLAFVMKELHKKQWNREQWILSVKEVDNG